jgi:hypothetical protein
MEIEIDRVRSRSRRDRIRFREPALYITACHARNLSSFPSERGEDDS